MIIHRLEHSLIEVINETQSPYLSAFQLKTLLITFLLKKQQQHTIIQPENKLLNKLQYSDQFLTSFEKNLIIKLITSPLFQLFEVIESEGHYYYPIKTLVAPAKKLSDFNDHNESENATQDIVYNTPLMTVSFIPHNENATISIRLNIENNALKNSVINISNSHLIYTFTFDKPVSEFDINDILVLGASKSSFMIISSKLYTLEIALLADIQDGNIVVGVIDNAIQGLIEIEVAQRYDTKAPTVNSIVMSNSTLYSGDTSVLTITFSEAVTHFDNSDLTVQNGTLSSLITQDGGITWTAIFTPTNHIEASNNVIELTGNYTDLAGNSGSGAQSANYTIDTVMPVVHSLIISDTALKIGDTATISIIFSEPVINFDNNDVIVQNGSLSLLTSNDGGITWTAIFSPTLNIKDGTNVITITPTYTNTSGHLGAGIISTNITIDTTTPIVSSITMSETILKIGDTSTITITFSETVNFNNSEVTVENGTLSTLTSSDGGITWTAVFTPNANIEDLTNVITISPTYTDLAGNTGSTFVSDNYAIDTKAPTVSSITLSDTDLKIGDTSTVTITFSEPVTNFDTNTVIAQNATLGTLTSSDGGMTWVGSLTPDSNIEDSTNILTVATTYTDIAGNTGSSFTSANYAVDTKAPTISIALSNSALKAGDTATVTITFSEAVTGFNNSDVTVENGTLSTLTSSDGGITWTATFTPTSNIEDATNIVSVASTYTDIAGNNGTAGTSANYTVDTKAPTVSSIVMSDTALKIGDTSTLTITFSEAITGFNNSDVTVENGTLSTLTSSNGDITWTATFTPTSNIEDATNIISIANTYTDLAGNTGTAGTSANYSIDTKAPTVISISMSDTALKIGDTSTVTIPFSEAVTGFNNSDVTVQNGTLSSLNSSDSGVTWVATFIPTLNVENPTNVISVASTYTDLAGNTGTGATGPNYAVDTKSPSISSISLSKTALKIGDTSTFTISFTEAVTGFDNSDVTPQNGTLSTLTTSNNITWTGILTPSTNIEDTTNIISIANTYTDLAGNPGVSGNSANYTIDTKAPTISITNDEPPGATIIVGNILFTFTFNEAVTGFTNSDITVTGGTKGTFTPISSSVYTLVVTPALVLAHIVGTINITIPAGAAQDAAGNGSVAKSYTDNSSGQTGSFLLFDQVLDKKPDLLFSDKNESTDDFIGSPLDTPIETDRVLFYTENFLLRAHTIEYEQLI